MAVKVSGTTVIDSSRQLANIASIDSTTKATLESGLTGLVADTDIGVTVQGYDAGLQSISGLTTAADKMIYTTAADTYAVTDLTAAGRAILDDADAAAQRTTLGLGTIATQAANNVSITGGSITGITDLAVADGGTGVSTVPTNGQLLIGNGTGYTVAALTAGTGISVTDGAGSITVAATNNGTVTSVGGTGTVNGLTLTGTVTSTGNLTLGGTLAISNADWSGTDLSVANGGTGASSFTANNVLLGNGTSAFQVVAPGTSGNVLTSNGTTWTSTAPTPGYTDADVDTHLNTGTASSGEVLSWTGSDYDWIAAPAALTGQTDSASPFETSLGVGAGSNSTGADNTFIGYNAGDSITTGYRNVIIGTNADGNATGTYDAVVIGREASSSSRENVAVGAGANAAVFCTSVGYRAHYTSGGGNSSVAVGYEAGRNVSGAYNVSLGNQAGYNITTGASNTALGRKALYGSAASKLTGSDNVGIGEETGNDLSTGANNFLGGYRAGYDLTTGSNNVAIGNGALDAATTGGRNIAIGQDAMGLGVATAASGDNVAIGYQAGQNITSAVNMVAIGSGALRSASYTANGSVALGFEALSTLVDYGFNTAVGYRAGASLNESENTAIGYQAAQSLTTGFASTAIGSNALSGSTGASEATAVGANALQNTNGRYNTGVGRRAGASVTSGQQNTLLGYQAARSGTNDLTTGSNNTVIGYNAAASSATVSNEITLGNSSITRFRIPGAGIDNTSAALSGTTPSVDVGARDTYTLTTSGNTTFTFTGAPSSGQVGTFSLIITAGGTHTLTWPASVDWAGGTAPDAPASGEKDIYTFMTVDGGTTWYGFLAGDAMA